MRRWLSGFEYAISLTSPAVIAIFIGATLLAITIAWAVVSGHAYRVARSNPGRALRTE